MIGTAIKSQKKIDKYSWQQPQWPFRGTFNTKIAAKRVLESVTLIKIKICKFVHNLFKNK